MAFIPSLREQISFRGAVKWIHGSYVRLEPLSKDSETRVLNKEKLFYVSDPELLSQIKEGDTVEFLCYHYYWPSLLAIEEEDAVFVYPVTALVSSDPGSSD